ncbi:choice-of-anchor A family protein [Clostridium thermobutyricum]|uniref:choice-of-anchor A family protein n=1 Tax=Clostridium thermobutyricum TaxID=29372 RepID=UPI0018A970D4|nr:collagen-binding domain-containing protein [Clostridium thermobutyricum]
MIAIALISGSLSIGISNGLANATVLQNKYYNNIINFNPLNVNEIQNPFNYNIFTLENLKANSVDSEGRVAVGGNINISNYGIGAKVKDNALPGLVVGGNLNISGGILFNNLKAYISLNSKVENYSYQQKPIRKNIIDFAIISKNLIIKNKNRSQ